MKKEIVMQLTDEEAALLDAYRRLNHENRKTAAGLLGILHGNESKNRIEATNGKTIQVDFKRKY